MRALFPLLLLALALFSGSGEADNKRMGPQLALPERESGFIQVVEKARADYAAAKTIDDKRAARIGLQIGIHNFLGLTHEVRDWIGTFKVSKPTLEGDRTLEIEIAPGLVIRTWETRFSDLASGTLLRPYAQLAKIAQTLPIGQPVLFDATLVGSVISTDDDMMQHQQIVARFTALKAIE